MHGYYYDPLHGHCLRRIRRTSPTTYLIDGVYGNDEKPYTHQSWFAVMTIQRAEPNGDVHVSVDFRGKPIKKNRLMTASYLAAKREVRWHEDGNVWRQLFVNPLQLR